MYLTFEEYTSFGGSATDVAFPKLERKAEHLLDYWTQDRIKSLTVIPDIVKETLSDMIDEMITWNDGERLASFSNGKVSMTFDVSKTEEQELYNIALVNLPVSLISGVVE